MKIINQTRLRRLDLTFAVGDLLDADVDAIVNSEQTDFVLSAETRSISGQILQRFGRQIQGELDQATQGEVFRPGTVLETSGGSKFRRIFHAGFHHPQDWPGVLGGSIEADYFTAIGVCVRQVLQAARVKQLRSLAFPLIGGGLFGLDERMLLLQFLDALETLDGQLQQEETLNVWLIIRNQAQLRSVVGHLLTELLRHRSETISVRMEQTGVLMLDQFAARLAERSNRDWAKWQLCRFTEIALSVMCYGLCRAQSAAPTPESMFEEGVPATFGILRDHATRLASTASAKGDAWGASFFASVLIDPPAKRALEELNTQRNNLAHGRRTLELDEIQRSVAVALKLDQWRSISQAQGAPRLGQWAPWITESCDGTRRTALFDRWQKKSYRYLVPETGELLVVPRRALT